MIMIMIVILKKTLNYKFYVLFLELKTTIARITTYFIKWILSQVNFFIK